MVYQWNCANHATERWRMLWNSVLCRWHHFLHRNWLSEGLVWRVRGSQQIRESPSSSQQAKKTSLNREIVGSGRTCVFVEGGRNHDKNLPQFRPIAPKNSTTATRRLAQFLQVGTVYKCGLRAGVSESMSSILLYCPWRITVCKWFRFLAINC